jgi:hypothetical protein
MARPLRLLLIGLILATGCAAPAGPWADASTTTTAAPATTPAPATTTAPATTATGPGPTTTAVAPRPDTRATLAVLAIDDSPPPTGYRRDGWPHWLDLDGDGCDARHQALKATSEIPPQVSAGCKVRAGRWTSAYDGLVATDPADIEIDHLVPLADAYRSGGDTWSTDQRARFANDPAELWPVSRSTNRSKSDDAPDQWRPPNRAAWCEYAARWVAVKVRYGLTARTAERDALGQMLDTCT